jgi:predicted pyridoxine 5'-phosphate oxidase superfamily flavin-nucleotide-binding protein
MMKGSVEAGPGLTGDVKRVVEEQRLGFVATVRPDGTPALSPKGTTSVWDDRHLVFLHLHSPGTVANVAENPHVEINVVDPIRRKGYRFRGTASVLTQGYEYESIVGWFVKTRGIRQERIHAAVLIAVDAVEALVSPAYDDGASEEEVSARWRRRHLL